ncbi:hypothetical protein [Verminephrobacter eiseniae]|uniref:hypothetical protein n=1 Tax=Verminephrobacter eiseniae TaxID=364317 RepID=UPI002236F925|nr:hypothetical protein [Verminephrobacter eiseniae]
MSASMPLRVVPVSQQTMRTVRWHTGACWRQCRRIGVLAPTPIACPRPVFGFAQCLLPSKMPSATASISASGPIEIGDVLRKNEKEFQFCQTELMGCRHSD